VAAAIENAAETRQRLLNEPQADPDSIDSRYALGTHGEYCATGSASTKGERPLALHLQRRAGKGPSTHLAHLFKTPKAASTQSPDEIA
jgi:hypothetical protein